jgi:deoxycytidylate deaminase
MSPKLIAQAIKKAAQSPCRHKISAFGFNKKGELVSTAFNYSRGIFKKGAGLHAEQIVMMEARRKGVKTIFICRVNPCGLLLPIEPCEKCKKIAAKLGIKIISVDSTN